MKSVSKIQNQINSPQNAQTQRKNFFLKVDNEKQQFKRKLSNLGKRIKQGASISKSAAKSSVQKSSDQKLKIDRKDTRQTDPTSSQSYKKNLYDKKLQQMGDLLEKAKNDPFLQRKIKSMMQNQLKSLMKLNNFKNSGQNSINGSKMNKKSSLNDQLDPSQILVNEYSRLPLDISMMLENSSLKKNNISIGSIGSQTPINERISRDFQDSRNMGKNNDSERGVNEVVTLRQQSYKNKISYLERLRQAKQLQVYTPQSTGSSSQGFPAPQNDQLWGKF